MGPSRVHKALNRRAESRRRATGRSLDGQRLQANLAPRCCTRWATPGSGPPRPGVLRTGRGTIRGVGLLDLIEVRAGVRSGKPCFVDTRIAVYDVLEYLAGGMSNDDIVADFPELNESHIRAALEFAAARERRLALPA